MKAKPPRPRDTNQLAYLIATLATGEASEFRTHDGKNAAAVALGRRGGLKGGSARAASLSATRRKEIARQAAEARWKTEKKK